MVKLNTITNIYLDESWQIVFELSETEYAHNFYGFENKNSSIPLCSSVACNAILKTSDNCLVFGKMSPKTHMPDRI